MNVEASLNQAQAEIPLNDLARLRQYEGSSAKFWSDFLRISSHLIMAQFAVMTLKRGGVEAWQKLAQNPGGEITDPWAKIMVKHLVEISEKCLEKSGQMTCLNPGLPLNARPYVLSIKLITTSAEDQCVTSYLLIGQSEAQLKENLSKLQLIADIPLSYQLFQRLQISRQEVERFAAVLDLMLQVNTQQRFLASGMALCNGVAANLRCDRVSLGWTEGGFIRLKAMSQTEHFDRQMAASKALECAMEEALDQDQEIIYPAPETFTAIARDHVLYAENQGISHVCSIPLRRDRKAVGVLTCERKASPFTDQELKELRLYGDQTIGHLHDLRNRDVWWGGRLSRWSRDQASKLVGVEHTWAKVLGIIISLALLSLVIVRLEYRVEAEFILQSDESAYITAAFDGYIKEVKARPGDSFTTNQALLHLVDDELKLEEANVRAEMIRYKREAEKARAAEMLADMRIAESLTAQAQAQLDLVRYRLAHTELRPPFNAVVVQGEQHERIGAPVKEGEVLFKVARLEKLYARAEIHERDIHEIKDQAVGEVAFASQPRFAFPVRISRLEKAAQAKEGKNYFVAHAQFIEDIQSWWRPGMTGIAKISAGKRTLLWIITHRTVDYLRMFFWW